MDRGRRHTPAELIVSTRTIDDVVNEAAGNSPAKKKSPANSDCPPSPLTPRSKHRLAKAKLIKAVRRVSRIAKEAHEIQAKEEEKDMDNVDHLLHGIDVLAMSWLGPVFFVTLGTKMVFVGNMDLVFDCVGQVALMFVGMIFMQFTSASFAARYVPGGFNFVESVMIGLGMMGRAELAFVVLDIAYVQNQLIGQESFFVLMFTCFLLNIVTPMLIMKWKPYYEGEKAMQWIMNGEKQKGG